MVSGFPPKPRDGLNEQSRFKTYTSLNFAMSDGEKMLIHDRKVRSPSTKDKLVKGGGCLSQSSPVISRDYLTIYYCEVDFSNYGNAKDLEISITKIMR